MSIDAVHPDYSLVLDDWVRIHDLYSGRNVEQYIEAINPEDTTEANQARNRSYRRRAVYMNIVGYTARGLLGLLYRQEPTILLPPPLQYLRENADGTGTSLLQQTQESARGLLLFGRAGLWVDYPATGGVASRAQQVNASVHYIDARKIINWSTMQENGRTKLDLVVFRDTTLERRAGEYELKAVDLIVELFLSDGIYYVRRWRRDAGTPWEVVDEVMPTDAQGNPWRTIPFVFSGSENNGPTLDPAPLKDIARINIGHYNNSAIYEDSVFICGQPQPWASGLDPDAVAGLYWGSGQLITVPSGETVDIAQAKPNTMVREAMNDKLSQALQMGAMLITPGTASKTATQVENEREMTHSVLSLLSANLSQAYEKALVWVGQYMGADTSELTFELSHDFFASEVDPNEVNAMLASYMQGGIPFADFWSYMQRVGLTDQNKTAADAQEEITPITPDEPIA